MTPVLLVPAPIVRTQVPRLIEAQSTTAPCQNQPTQHVGHGSHEALERWLLDRERIDAETIERIEQQLEHQAGDPHA